MKESEFADTPFGRVPASEAQDSFERDYMDAMMELKFESRIEMDGIDLEELIDRLSSSAVEADVCIEEVSYEVYRQGFLKGLQIAAKAHRIKTREDVTPRETEEHRVERLALRIIASQPEIPVAVFAREMDADSVPISNPGWLSRLRDIPEGPADKRWVKILRVPLLRGRLDVWLTRQKKRYQEHCSASELLRAVETLPQVKTLRRRKVSKNPRAVGVPGTDPNSDC